MSIYCIFGTSYVSMIFHYDLSKMDKIELCGASILTINWLKKLAQEIREPNDNDI